MYLMNSHAARWRSPSREMMYTLLPPQGTRCGCVGSFGNSVEYLSLGEWYDHIMCCDAAAGVAHLMRGLLRKQRGAHLERHVVREDRELGGGGGELRDASRAPRLVRLRPAEQRHRLVLVDELDPERESLDPRGLVEG